MSKLVLRILLSIIQDSHLSVMLHSEIVTWNSRKPCLEDQEILTCKDNEVEHLACLLWCPH